MWLNETQAEFFCNASSVLFNESKVLCNASRVLWILIQSRFEIFLECNTGLFETGFVAFLRHCSASSVSTWEEVLASLLENLSAQARESSGVWAWRWRHHTGTWLVETRSWLTGSCDCEWQGSELGGLRTKRRSSRGGHSSQGSLSPVSYISLTCLALTGTKQKNIGIITLNPRPRPSHRSTMHLSWLTFCQFSSR